MDLYEFQSRKLLNEQNIPIHRDVLITDIIGINKAIEILNNHFPLVLKAQVKTGGRGKAGGVKLAKNLEEVKGFAQDIFALNIKGHDVHSILITEAAKIVKEFYCSILFDRSKREYLLVFCSEGGVEIEEVAKSNPNAIIKHSFSPVLGLNEDIADEMCKKIKKTSNLNDDILMQIKNIMKSMWQVYKTNDATLVEINPLALCEDENMTQKIYALDAKISVDDNSIFRHQEKISEYEKFHQNMQVKNELDDFAKQNGINYVGLDGNIGIIGNGAGLVMSTLDVVSFNGGAPANFLDIGGGASKEHMQKSLKLIHMNAKVDAILINIFGGLTQCDLVANGIIDALSELNIKTDIVVRFSGNNAKLGLDILKTKNLPQITVAKNMEEAAQKVVEKASENLKNRQK